MRLMVVEDDERTAEYLRHGFMQAGHIVESLGDGRDALSHAGRSNVDVIIVDRMLPGLDGLSLVRSLRAIGISTPVIFLTAVNGVDDRVEGLESGGDDYLVKPFAFSELMARVSALARRPAPAPQKTVLQIADLELDLVRRTCRRGGALIDLLPREFRLLEYLVRNEGRVVTRTMLLERVWDFNFNPQASVVEIHISRLRAKVDRPFNLQLIHTVRHIGYTAHD